MQINNLSKLVQYTSNFKQTNNSEKLNINESFEPTTKPVGKQFDVRNISPNEFKDLIRDLRESGQISELDSMALTADRLDMERFGGAGSDTKMDMVDYFERLVDGMKSIPGSVGIEYQERSLNILKALDARSNANIPESV